MALASNCDSCGEHLLEDHAIGVLLPPVRPPKAFVCSPICEQNIVKQALLAPTVDTLEKDRFAKSYASIAALIGYVPVEQPQQQQHAPEAAVTPVEAVSAALIATPQQENALIEVKLFDKVKNLVTKEGEVATYDTDAIEKEIIKRLDYFGEEVSLAEQELKRDAAEIYTAALEYLARKSVSRPAELYKGEFKRQWTAALEVENQSTSFYPNPKGAIKRDLKKEYSNKKLGEEFGALIRATNSVERGSDVAELSFAIRSVMHNITKKYKRGVLGLKLMQRLVI